MTTQYIGSRYVPVFADPVEWSSTKAYEPLTIVLHEGNSYTSKQYVPVGVDINNTKYWAETGNYNAQVEQYRHEVLDFADTIVNKAFAFDTVADMQSSNELYVGAICHTNGFHARGDGGAAYYTVSANGTRNDMDVIALRNGLYAIFTRTGVVALEQLGMNPTATNNHTIFNYGISTYKTVVCNKDATYNFRAPISIPAYSYLDGNKCTFQFSINHATESDYCIYVNSYTTVKNITALNDYANGTMFQFGNGSASTRNTTFDNVVSGDCSIAFNLNRAWVCTFNSVRSLSATTTFKLSDICHQINVNDSNFEYHVTDFMVSDTTESSIFINGCTIESFTGHIFKFNKSDSHNTLSIINSYFENRGTENASGYGPYPLIKGESPYDVYTIDSCKIAYCLTVDANGIIKTINTNIDAKAAVYNIEPYRYNNRFFSAGNIMHSVDAPLFSDFNIVKKFADLTFEMVPAASTTFKTQDLPDYYFSFYGANGAPIANTFTPDTSISSLYVWYVGKDSSVKLGQICLDVVWDAATVQSTGKFGTYLNYEATGGTTLPFNDNRYNNWIKSELHQQLNFAAKESAGTAGGKQYYWKFYWYCHALDPIPTYKIKTIALSLT